MIEVRYIVKHKFEYFGKTYLPGEEWEPRGGRWDKQIAEHYVRMEPVAATKEETNDKKTRQTNSGRVVQY